MSFDKNQTTGRPRLAALQQGAGALGLAVLSAGALAGNPGACAAIADNTERLACYDESVGRPHQEAPPPAAAVPLAREPSALSKRWELDAEDKRGTFLITPYKPTYILLGRWTNSANRMPTSPNPANALNEPVDVDPVEAKYQISFKTKLWEGLVGRHGDLWLGYTQQSNWQVYNKSFSSPFRETGYEPELMAVFRTNLDAGLGFKVKMLSVGLNHQSNGRGQPLSRSWNRIYAQAGFEYGDSFSLLFKPWYRIPEKSGADDNPHITDYMGNFELVAHYKFGKHSFTALGRSTFEFKRGLVQVDWSYPLYQKLRGYLQLTTGHGESLIDYNQHQNTLGIGVMLTDWM